MTGTGKDNLWHRFKEGEDAAFAELYNTYFAALYNYASKLTPDKELVKDCIQDLFIQLWEKRSHLSYTTSIKFYLFKALRHAVVNALVVKRKTAGNPIGSDSEQFIFMLPYESELITQQLDEQMQQQLLRVLNNLTERQKEAIFLRFYSNLTYEEIAAILSINIDATYNLIYRALTFMRKNIGSFGLLLLFAPVCQ